MPYEYTDISEEQKEFFKLQLQRDSSKDFSSEFIRTTDMERKIINEHGFDGIKLVFETQNSENYFQLGEFPSNCPWAGFNNLDLIGCIEANFKAIENKIPNLLEAMKDRCRFIYVERKETDWKMHYFLDMTLFDGREYYRIYAGGKPNPNPQPNETLTKFGWTVPFDLAEFYAIYDGFGEIADANFILSSQEISVMGEMMNQLCKDQGFPLPEEYNFNDLLEFFPDGAGNVQCFYRKNSDSENMLTVDWDHETWEISEESDFYDFIDERMSALDEE